MQINRSLFIWLYVGFIVLISAAAFYGIGGSDRNQKIIIAAEESSFGNEPGVELTGSDQTGGLEGLEGSGARNEDKGPVYIYASFYRIEDHGTENYGIEKKLTSSPGETTRPELPDQPPPPQESLGVQSSTSLSSREQQMVSAINQARGSAGLPPLQVSSQVTAAARAKSRDMAVNNYFSHNSPTYGRFTGLLDHYGVSYRSAGENLAWNTNGSVSAAHSSLMNSSGHRANILGRGYSHVGVGVYQSGGRYFYTQLYIGR